MLVQSTPKLLLTLNGFEQCLKVTFSKRLCAFSLDNFEEHGGSGLHRLGENLEQIPFIITIYQNTEFFQWGDVLIDFPHTVGHCIVVGGRDPKEFHTPALEVTDGLDNVIRGDGN